MTEPSRFEVWKMFDQISKTYDRVNRVVSFGRDQAWRRKLSAFLPNKSSLKLLDVATGTGDQLLALLDQNEQIEKAVGIDLSVEMLKIAEQKASAKPYSHLITFQKGDAEKLPFPSESFDAVTLSFGIRNVPSPLAALSEIHRVLKPKGKALILEFSLPPHPIRPAYLFYLRHVLPALGRLLSRHGSAYRYLNQTIETFPFGDQFAQIMKEAGFSKIEIHPMALGAVS